MASMTINPNECKAGKSRGVLFRTGAHERKRKNAKRDRREFSRSRKDFRNFS